MCGALHCQLKSIAICLLLSDLPNIVETNRNQVIVEQSNTWSTCYANRSINRLNGQNVTNDIELCVQCSVAHHIAGIAWWQLDLAHAYVVYYIMIYGRKDSKIFHIIEPLFNITI